MFIPDPGSDFFSSRIQDPGSELSPSRIPDPHQRILSILTQKNGVYIRIPDPDADFLPIPDSGSRGQKAPDPGSGSATLGTEQVPVSNPEYGTGIF
jgi:hypothetical protein